MNKSLTGICRHTQCALLHAYDLTVGNLIIYCIVVQRRSVNIALFEEEEEKGHFINPRGGICFYGPLPAIAVAGGIMFYILNAE